MAPDPSSRIVRAMLPAGVLVITACTSVAPAPDAGLDGPLASSFLSADPTPLAAVLDGLDPQAGWRLGDSVAYELTERRGGDTRLWQLELSIQGGADATSGSSWSASTDPEGHKEGGALRRGPADVRIALERPDGTLVDTLDRWTTIAHCTQSALPHIGSEALAQQFLNFVGQAQLFEALLGAVRRPSLLSIVRELGSVKLMVHVGWPTEEEAFGRVLVRTPDGRELELPVVALPVEILANGEPALYCTAWVTWCQSPLLLGAGLVALEGRHPTDPTRTVELRLVRATRGAEAGAQEPWLLWDPEDPRWK